MAWLGEELPASQQGGATPFAPRCIKDLIEERLFAQRRDLFSSLSMGFFDTTSVYFEGEGGRTLGEYGLRGCVRRPLFADNTGSHSKEAHLWPGLPIPAT